MSIACCFMNFDVRVELILFICERVKQMKCLGASCCLKYLESDYVNRLKYKQSSRHRNGTSSVLVKSGVTLEGDCRTHGSDASSRSNHSGSIASELTLGGKGGPKQQQQQQYDETSQLLDRMVPMREERMNPEYNEAECSSGGDSKTSV